MKTTENSLKNGYLDLYHSLIRIVFPVRCISCKKVLKETNNVRLCNECLPNYMIDEVFEKSSNTQGAFDFGLYSKSYINGLTNGLKYEGKVRQAFINFKFNDKTCYGYTFAHCMANRQTSLPFCDFILSVPISKERLRERGYNQSELIAENFEKITGIEYKKNVLFKIKNNQQQSMLSPSQRLHNVNGVYKIYDDFKVDKKSILLIDDIYTTGSTVNECAKILKRAGAKQVHVLTALRAFKK